MGGGGGGSGGAIEVGKLDVKVGTGARTALDVGTGTGISSVVLGSGGGIIGGIGADGTGIGITMLGLGGTITTGGSARDVEGSGTAVMDDGGIGSGAEEIGITNVANVEGAGGRLLANDEGGGKVVYCVKVTVTMRVVSASEGRCAV